MPLTDGFLPGAIPLEVRHVLIRVCPLACARSSPGAVLATLAACAVGTGYRRPRTAPCPTWVHERRRSAFPRSADESHTRDRRERKEAARLGPCPTRTPRSGSVSRIRCSTTHRAALRENHDLSCRWPASTRRMRCWGRHASIACRPSPRPAGAADSRSSADQLPGKSREDRDTDSYGPGRPGWGTRPFRPGPAQRRVASRRRGGHGGAISLPAGRDRRRGRRSYLEMRGLQQRLRVARSNAENQRETLRIVEARLDAGRGTEFDTSRARAQLEATLSRDPGVRRGGRRDDASARGADGPTARRAGRQARRRAAAAATAGRGRRRRRRANCCAGGRTSIAAEQRLHAATARIGVRDGRPVSPLYAGWPGRHPGVGHQRTVPARQRTRLVTLGVDWSFLDVGRVRARIAASDAGSVGSLAQYEQTVLRALEETENALRALGHARLEDAHLERSAVESARAAELARVRSTPARRPARRTRRGTLAAAGAGRVRRRRAHAAPPRSWISTARWPAAGRNRRRNAFVSARLAERCRHWFGPLQVAAS